MRFLLRRLWFFPVLVFSGCASVVSPGPDPVKFTSEPPGAQVSIDGKPAGKTPITVDVARNAKYVTFALDGYEDQELPVARKENPWTSGNAIVGGVVGAMADSQNNNNQMAAGEMTAHLHHKAPAVGPTTKP